jgi:AmmeMemoRadiSam system protein A
MAHTLEPPPAIIAEPGLPPPVTLTQEERAALLEIARAAVGVAVQAAPVGELRAALERHPVVERRAAAFVTLTEDGELRGCVGHMDADTPVAESVVEAANWAALGDPRFPSVRAQELSRLHLEVSVLGPLVRQADPSRWRLGIDGIVVERGMRRGLLLPEVGPMLGQDRTAMLDTACRKAGLPAGAWRDPGTTLYAFRTDRFGGAAVADGAEG